ncbi:MAG: prepilin-type N-terminal cleavage/methylation domain-containing protein [Nodosilinea sp.]
MTRPANCPPSPPYPWPIAYLRHRVRAHPAQGLTLIECLVAIVIVALVASAIAPALVIAAATRVQSQKAEQALQLAQSEIDRVRLLTERGQATDTLPVYLAKFPPRSATLANKDVQTMAAPAYGSVIADRTNLDSTKTLGIKLNSTTTVSNKVELCAQDCDFAVQIYRTKGYPDDTTKVPTAFAMGVRVYSYEAVASGTGAALSTQPLSLATTAGEGQRAKKPLAVLYTTIAIGENSTSLCDLIDYTAANQGTTGNKPSDCQN